jgi:hypothetical protein
MYGLSFLTLSKWKDLTQLAKIHFEKRSLALERMPARLWSTRVRR